MLLLVRIVETKAIEVKYERQVENCFDRRMFDLVEVDVYFLNKVDGEACVYLTYAHIVKRAGWQLSSGQTMQTLLM